LTFLDFYMNASVTSSWFWVLVNMPLTGDPDVCNVPPNLDCLNGTVDFMITDVVIAADVVCFRLNFHNGSKLLLHVGVLCQLGSGPSITMYDFMISFDPLKC
jgi:hypothetical protein